MNSFNLNLQAKAACVLIDLCCGVLAPWTAQVIAKVMRIVMIECAIWVLSVLPFFNLLHFVMFLIEGGFDH